MLNLLLSRHSLLLPVLAVALIVAHPAVAQEEEPQEAVEEAERQPPVSVDAGSERNILVNKTLSLEAAVSDLPEGSTIQEIVWDFGDGVRATGEKVTHSYTHAGSYEVALMVKTDAGQAEDTVTVNVFERIIILIADASAPEDQLELRRQQAAKEGILLSILQAKGSGPEVLIEEELTQQLLGLREDIPQANLIIGWTSGGVGANVLSKFSQNLRQAKSFFPSDLALNKKGIILLSETPLAVLAPAAQSAFDQLQPAYVIVTRPAALELLTTVRTSEEARDAILNSPLDFRLLGTFSSRTVSDLSITNFMSFGINFLVNRGVPINSIILILMLPVIATILAFARQVIGIKAFGLITPAMTTVSFLVMGLPYGLAVFAAVLIAGTLTRAVVRRLRLLYLPRMALVLTSVSLALLLLLGLGVATDRSGVLSFSLLPALILTILAEEFIALQFKSGLRQALAITGWTLLLAILCYSIVSWELFRTLILSYPELVLLAIPINIGLGQWGGLRLTEYFRFRTLLRHDKPAT